MAWLLRQNEDETWDWQVIQSAYGIASGHEDDLATAMAALTVAEGVLLEEPMSAEMSGWFLAHARAHLQAIRHGLIDEIGHHVFPLDPKALKRHLKAL